MGWAVLKITDGTKANTIDLLSPKSGYLLDDWRPAIQIPKSGGIWNGSPLADGRRLAMRNYENAIEVFNLKASKGSQDELIRELQNLFRLMDMAVNYWITGWQTCPVWIEARATNESNSRYATIMDYRISGLNNPYAQPFFACPSIEDELALTVEHDYWMEQPPGTATAIQIGAQQAFNGITFGRSATILDEVFLANKHPIANITHAYWWDNVTGFSPANLLASALPYDLFPPNPSLSNNDRLYIGSSTAVTNSGPFSGIVFDITTAAVNITDITWYYWNGAWTAIPNISVTYNPLAPLGLTGVFSINFQPPSDWTTTAVNGVTAYWITGQVTVAANSSPPQQGNRHIYAPVTPFVDIVATQVPGDVPALSKIVLTNLFDSLAVADGDRDLNVLLAIRTLSRGSTFTPYINLADEQNQTGITITAGTDVAIATDVGAPAGRAYRWQATTNADAARLTIGFSSALLPSFIGKYIVFLRYRAVDAGTTRIYLKTIITSVGAPTYQSLVTLYEGQQQSVYGDEIAVEMGIINIPNVAADSFKIQIFGSDTASTNDVYFYDLILMPIDEWAAHYKGEWYGDEGVLEGEYVLVDSISTPKDYHKASLMTPTDYLKSPLSPNAPGQSILQPNVAQRIWVFARNTQSKTSIGNFNAFRMQVWRTARYMAMRGNR